MDAAIDKPEVIPFGTPMIPGHETDPLLKDLEISAPEGETSGLATPVYQSILAGITNGVYQPNMKLPSETQLSTQFGVSRPVVRTALARLKRENFIVSRQGAGSFVSAAQAKTPLGFAPVETIADIQRCYEYRLTIEPHAAAHAALRRNSVALEGIASALDALDQATRQGVHRDDVDFTFHLAIAEASNNHYYRHSMLALQAHIAVGMHIHGVSLMGPKAGLDYVLEEHRQIFRAIEAGQPDAAKDAMIAHLLSSRDRLFEGRLLDLSMQ